MLTPPGAVNPALCMRLVRRTFDSAIAGYELYFTGPPPMTQGLQEMLRVEFRVAFGQVHFDRFFF
jgi:toluene monooxygenase electron transfer component